MDGRGPQEVRQLVLPAERVHEAHGGDRDLQMDRHPEDAVLERPDAAVERPASLGEDQEARPAFDRLAGEPVGALQARGGARVRDGDVPEPLHEPAVDRDPEVRFELKAAEVPWHRAVEHERVEDVHVVAREEACELRVEPGRDVEDDARSGETDDALRAEADEGLDAAPAEDLREHEDRGDDDAEVEDAHRPEHRAAQEKPRQRHARTSSLPGSTSSERQWRRFTSPSIITPTGPARSKSTRRTARREAPGRRT